MKSSDRSEMSVSLFQAGILFGIVLSIPLINACAVTPTPLPEAVYRYGEIGTIRVEGENLIEALSLVNQSVRRDSDENLVVKTKWRNQTDKPVEVRLKGVFFDNGKENHSGEWSRQTFEAGRIVVIEWRSYTPEAEGFLIEVKPLTFFH